LFNYQLGAGERVTSGPMRRKEKTTLAVTATVSDSTAEKKRKDYASSYRYRL